MRKNGIVACLVAAVGLLAAPVMAQSGTLSTETPNNGSGGVFLDLTALSAPLMVTSFDVAYSGTVGTTVEVEVYVRTGSYVGFDGDPTGWTLTQTVSGTRQGTTVLDPLVLTQGIMLNVGEVTGVYLHAITSGGGIRYWTATAQQEWSNSDLHLFSDVSRTGNIPFAGGRFTPRAFAGNINYDIIPAPGAIALLGLAGVCGVSRRRRA